jgi:hypothetical protein
VAPTWLVWGCLPVAMTDSCSGSRTGPAQELGGTRIFNSLAGGCQADMQKV